MGSSIPFSLAMAEKLSARHVLSFDRAGMAQLGGQRPARGAGCSLGVFDIAERPGDINALRLDLELVASLHLSG